MLRLFYAVLAVVSVALAIPAVFAIFAGAYSQMSGLPLALSFLGLIFHLFTAFYFSRLAGFFGRRPSSGDGFNM